MGGRDGVGHWTYLLDVMSLGIQHSVLGATFSPIYKCCFSSRLAFAVAQLRSLTEAPGKASAGWDIRDGLAGSLGRVPVCASLACLSLEYVHFSPVVLGKADEGRHGGPTRPDT